jgi:hypothetical protein
MNSAACVGGKVPTFYVDDADTDGFSLRTGTMNCSTGATVTGPPFAVPGDKVTLNLGPGYAGQTVYVWMYSSPVLLGTSTVSQTGTVSAVIPAGTALGDHTLAVTRTDGTLIGATGILVRGVLAFTGPAGAMNLAIGAVLMMAVGAMLLRRKRA